MDKSDVNELAGLSTLLALATEAKGEEPMNAEVPPMAPHDRQWLEAALREIASDSDPIKNLKRQMARLNQLTDLTSSSSSSDEIQLAFDDLTDSICDMDLALDFCKLDGLSIVKRMLDGDKEQLHCISLSLISELAQNNPKVQIQVLLKELHPDVIKFLESSATAKLKLKALGAISACVKGHIPALVKFAKLGGVQALRSCFEEAIDKKDGELMKRAVVVAVNISVSFNEQFNRQTNLDTLIDFFNSKLTEQSTREDELMKDICIEALEYMKEVKS